ncbi:hypothetical protein GCM10010358_38850 [Streptomyces minutiscleroticus]|uniref:Uncharacterized protein n=1 Tax=Streptomyces minutiscleroticus TaxID=68238 RepID=A0A918NMF1_9ACTN|nr:hypothetical protein GCM10010358_38850 [Streptomyces minutiscleroticus]
MPLTGLPALKPIATDATTRPDTACPPHHATQTRRETGDTTRRPHQEDTKPETPAPPARHRRVPAGDVPLPPNRNACRNSLSRVSQSGHRAAARPSPAPAPGGLADAQRAAGFVPEAAPHSRTHLIFSGREGRHRGRHTVHRGEQMA